MPNRENIKKWIAALRSGEYKQGKFTLRTYEDEYCCLGVACDVFRIETGSGEWESKHSYWQFVVRKERINLSLPPEVRDWLGLEGTDPQVPTTPERETHLSWLNDYANYDFNMIADLIENTFLKEESNA